MCLQKLPVINIALPHLLWILGSKVLNLSAYPFTKVLNKLTNTDTNTHKHLFQPPGFLFM